MISDIKARKAFLRAHGHCFNCLNTGHISRNCDSTTRCYFCKSHHNSAICDKRKAKPAGCSVNTTTQLTSLSQPLPVSAAPVINLSNQPPTEEERTDEVQQRVYYVDSKTNVLLQTAEAVISDVADKKHVKARILLDPGSERTYISECVRNCLQLETDHQKMVNVKTFAGERMNVLDATKFCIKSLDQNLTVYVNGVCVNKICDLLINQPIQIVKENFKHLKDLELSDSGNGGLEVDILLGADFYWEIVSCNMRRGGGGGGRTMDP